MKVKLIKTEKNWLNSERCEATTASSGTHYFPDGNRRCARFAAFDVDGKRLCKQHAGELALLHVIKG